MNTKQLCAWTWYLCICDAFVFFVLCSNMETLLKFFPGVIPPHTSKKSRLILNSVWNKPTNQPTNPIIWLKRMYLKTTPNLHGLCIIHQTLLSTCTACKGTITDPLWRWMYHWCTMNNLLAYQPKVRSTTVYIFEISLYQVAPVLCIVLTLLLFRLARH